MKMIAPSNLADDTSRVKTALAALAPTGGRLYVCSGTYRLSSTITVPLNVTIDAERGAIWVWAHDLGPGVPALTTAPSAQGQEPIIRGLILRGPGSQSEMDGFAPMAGVDAHDIFTQGFRAGIAIRQDHNGFFRCHSSGNRWNIYFGDNPQSHGNTQFVGCWMDGASEASIAVAYDNIIEGCNFVGGHVGGAPYAFLKLPPTPQNVGGNGFIHATTVDALAFEGVGVSAFCDQGTSDDSSRDSLSGLDLRCPGFSWGSTPSGQTADYAIDVRRITNSRIFCGERPFLPGAKAVIRCQGDDSFDYDCSGDLPLPFVDSQTGMTVRSGHNWTARVYHNASQATIAVGDPVETGGGWFEVLPFGTWSGNFRGVAMNTALPGGPVVVCERGRVLAKMSVTVTNCNMPLAPGVGALVRTTTGVNQVATSIGGGSGIQLVELG